MKKIAFYLFIILNSSSILAQTTLIYEGHSYSSSVTADWEGVNIPRNQPTIFTFRNNSVTSVNASGYLIQAGDESPGGTNNNLDGEVISGNRFTWNGTDASSITHGVFTGYNLNAVLKYNYLLNVPLGLLRKSSGMTNTGGGVAYNIVINSKSAVVAKGINNVNIYNNTIYSNKTLAQSGRGLVDIYTNTDTYGGNAPSKGAKVYNNIFYTKHQIFNIKIYETSCLQGFECDYNLYWCEDGDPIFEVNGVQKSFAQWQAMGYDAHSVVRNPNFKDFVNFVPSERLDYGTNLGGSWETGLAEDAVWGSSDPKTSVQNGTWQVGARVYSSQMIPVSNISVSGTGGATTISANKGSLQLNAAISPSNATNKSVSWSVTNGSGQATINSSGVLSAVDNGNVTATASAVDGSGTVGTLEVNISNQIIPVTAINVSGTGGINRINTDNGELQLIAEILPSNASNKSVTWSIVSGADKATISSTGNLAAIDNGTVIVQAAANDGSGVSGTISIYISNQIIPVTGINLSGNAGATTITSNKGTLQLVAGILPVNATDKSLTWSIQSGAGLASVNPAGLLTAIDNGIVIVKASSNDGSMISGTISITISNQTVSVNGITITGNLGINTISSDNGTLQLTAEVSPANATNKTVTWIIANGIGLATVSPSGLVSALDNGTVTVKATATDGSNVFGTIVITISNQVVFVSGISVTGAGGSSAINNDNGYLQLTANVTPANASNKNVTWSIVNGTGNANISPAGLVTASADGTVTATATATDGSGIAGSIVITISNQIIKITGITIEGTGGSATIASDNGSLALIPVILPANATNKTLTWSIINGQGLATVNSSGVVTAIENGAVTVKATAADGTGIFATFVITLTNQIVPVAEIIVTGAGGASIITSDIGSLQLSAGIAPATATDKSVVWSVINGTGMASINSTGLITASASGSVTAVATANDGSHVSGSLAITISPTIITVSSVSLSGAGGITTISSDGGTLQLNESILPANATDKTVQWSVVNNTGQAVISPTGLVTALGNGTVTARATANDGSGAFGTLEITISNQIIPVSSINVSGQDGINTISADNGTLQLISEVLPLYATLKSVLWSVTNNTGMANVNASGLLTAESDGTVTARATAADGSGVYGTMLITISNQIVPVSNISITGAGGLSVISIDKGSLQLTAGILPLYATNKSITWSVSDGTGHATISQGGLVSAVTDGTVTATATANDGSGVSGSLTITISNQLIPVTGITVSGAGGISSITTDNGTLQLNSIVLPANATDKAVIWSIVGGTGLASISAQGNLTAADNGTITVTATAHDGSGIYGTLVVSISNQIASVSSINVTGAGGLTAINSDDGSLQMIADVLPSAALNKNVTWSLENNAGIAAINSSGRLTALDNGTVRVRATSQENSAITGFLDIVISNQVIQVTNISIAGAGGSSSITSDKGSLQLTSTVLPLNATDKSVTWSVITNTGLATVNSSGLLTALNNGSVTVRAMARDGSGTSSTINVTISNQIVLVSGIVISGAANATIITQDNGTLQLTANVAPANANNKSITWSLVNGTGQASINSSGLVTAISDGNVTARATATDGSGVSGTLVLTMFNQINPVTGITVNSAGGATTISTDNGTLQMSAAILPANATNKNVTWSVSSGGSFASISSSGLVTAYDNGTIVVRATARDGSGISGTRTITITNQLGPVTSITVTAAGGAASINTDDGTLQLTAAVLPSNSTRTVTWSFVNDIGLATINANGLVTAVGNGTITVKATANDGSGVSGTLVITITNQIIPVTSLSISVPGGLTSITENKGSLQLGCMVLPENATNKTFSWSVENNSGQATIDDSGLVTAVENGSVTVRAIANDGSGISSSVVLTITGQLVPVSEVIVSAPEGITSITKNNSGLQLKASVLPLNASVHTVSWAIVRGTGLASIDSSGLLTAIDNGVVTVKATANDGSGKYGSITIPILNQEGNNLKISVTRDEIKVYLNDNYINWRADLYSFYGNVVIEKYVANDLLVFDISNQPSGIYLILLSKGHNLRVAKAIKP